MDKNTAFFRNNQMFNYSFDAQNVSTDGSILLTKKIAQKSGYLKSFSGQIPDYRNPLLVKYSIEDFVTQRVLMMMQGYDDCNDVQRLNHDPLIEAVLGTAIASQPSLSRFENNIDKKSVINLCYWFAERYVEGLKPGTKEIIIDVDGTDDPTYGQQEFTFFNSHYNTDMYMQIFFKDGVTGQLIVPVLLPGCYNSKRLFVPIVKRLIRMVRCKLPNVKITVRADSAYSKPEFYKMANEIKNVFLHSGYQPTRY